MMLLADSLATDVTLSTLPCWVPIIELEAPSARLLALALPTEMKLSTLPCGVPMTLDEIESAALLAIEEPDETASAIEDPVTDATDSMVPCDVLEPTTASLAS